MSEFTHENFVHYIEGMTVDTRKLNMTTQAEQHALATPST